MRRIFLLALLLTVCANVFAQQPPKLTWLRFYTVPPGKDADFLRLVNDSSRAMFDRLMADGTVVGWGVAVPLTHDDQPWTHVVYVGLRDWNAAEKLVRSIESSDMDAKRSAAEVKRLDELAMNTVMPGSIRDVLLRHLVQSEVPPAAKPKYIGVDFYTVKQGRAGDALGLFNEWATPMFKAATQRGKLGPWGFSWQDQMPGYTHMVWYFMSDLTALDEDEAAMGAMDPMKLRGFEVRLRDLSEPEKHHMQLLRIVQSMP